MTHAKKADHETAAKEPNPEQDETKANDHKPAKPSKAEEDAAFEALKKQQEVHYAAERG